MPTTAPRAYKRQHCTSPDFLVSAHGSLFTLLPTSDAACEHLDNHVGNEALWWCGALVVEHRFIRDLCAALADDGFALTAH